MSNKNGKNVNAKKITTITATSSITNRNYYIHISPSMIASNNVWVDIMQAASPSNRSI